MLGSEHINSPNLPGALQELRMPEVQRDWNRGWGRPTPTLVPWRQGFRLQQGTSVGAGLPKPGTNGALLLTIGTSLK
jgi:hypothetical protein